MNTVESYRATIWFGLAFQAGVALVAAIVGNHLAMMLIVAGAGMSYVTQALNTTSCILEDQALLSVKDSQTSAKLASAYRYRRVAVVLWMIAVAVCVAAYLSLLVPYAE